MNYKDFNRGDWIGCISGAIEDERELDGNEMRDLVEFLTKQKSVIENIKAEIGTLCDNIDCWNCVFRDKTLADKKVLTYCKLGQIFDKHLCEVKE